jgi:uncharacterized protein YbaR (Trm112 family)
MPADSTSHSSGHASNFDPSVVGQLACPACSGGLRLEEDRLLCAACGRAYLIVDGIPVLVAGREGNPQNR